MKCVYDIKRYGGLSESRTAQNKHSEIPDEQIGEKEKKTIEVLSPSCGT